MMKADIVQKRKNSSIKKESFTIVAIGASAGGLEAISELLKNVTATTGMAYIIVQHLSPDHKSLLVPLLSKVTKMKVQEIEDMEKMEPDNVYVIPYNKEIEVTNGHIKLIPRPKNKPSNLSVDVLFSSLAETHHSNVIGVVLSGNASDGTRGLKEIKLEGGITFAQDDSAKFSSMPKSAIAEGVVDFILSPKEIAKEIISLSKHSLIKPTKIEAAPEDEIENNNADLKIILQLLHKRKNIDFSHYKMNTVKRRILRRMLIHKLKTIKSYAELVSKKNDEINLLYTDLLINVTDFFRDTDAFTLLKKTVLSKLLKSKAPGETLRIWVAACATGEEVYSIAMSLNELQDSKTNNIPFQIFASDLSAEAIRIARNGEYTALQLKNISPKRLQRFFVKVKDKYRISQSLRDVCIFAQHNILIDPPFSRMDFISCRNFLIYLETSAQKKAISTFHYALNEGGCLMLGKSETIGTSTQFFAPLNKTYKIYCRKNHTDPYRIPDLMPRTPIATLNKKNNTIPTLTKKIPVATSIGMGNAFDSVLLAQYVPASVIINHDMEILQFRGNTALYLKQSSGKASFNILKMVNTEITFELRNAIHHAIKSKQTVSKVGIEMDRDVIKNTVQLVNLEVAPLKVEGEEALLVVVFTGQQIEIAGHATKGIKSNSIAKDRRIKKLEEELASARYDMGSITHDQEAANEELQSANEEAVSSNEELQSLNEELETSKEETESTNEELTTTNQELQSRIQQVEELYNYYEGILATFHEPMLVLDKNMRVKTANNSFYKMFHVNEDDSLGVSLYKLGDNQWNIPKLRELLEDIVPKNNRFHDFEVEHTFPKIGHKTMLLNAHRIIQKSKHEELIVLTISDITEVKRLAIELQVKEKKALEEQLKVEQKALKKIEESEKRYNMMLMKSPFAFAVLKGKNMVITLANDSVKEMWGKGKDLEGKPLFEVLPEIKDTAFPGLLDKVYTTGIPFSGEELLAPVFRNGKLEDVYFNFVYQPYLEADETISGVTIIAIEVTNEVIAKQKIKDSQQQLQNIFMQAPFALNIYEGKELVISLANKLFCEIIGKTESEILGKKLFDAFPETATQGLDKILSDIFSTGIPFKGNEFPVHFLKHGNEFKGYFDFIYQPIFDYNKNVSGVINVAIDVTDKVLARKKIEESEERFRSLADNVPIHFFIIEPNAEATISYWNKNWLDYTGKSFEEAIGNTWGGVMHPDDLQGIMDIYVPAFEKRQAYFLPAIRVRRHDGEYRWHSVQANPRYLPSGEFMGYIGIGFDIHESKLAIDALKTSEEHFRQMADLMPAKISNAMVDGSVTFFNKHWLDFSGFSFEELRDFGYHQIMHPDEIEEFQTRFQHAASTLTDLVMEMRFKNTDGDYIWHLNIASPIKDEKGNLKMWIGVTSDISEQIKIRDLNLGIYEKHANELKQAIAMAELATLKAEDAVKSKQQFLSNMSHEIRTPMNAIIGFTNVMLKTDLSDKQLEFLRAIKTSGEALTVLINDILDLAKVDAGKMTFEKKAFKMEESISAMLHLFETKIVEKNLELVKQYDAKIPAVLVGDPVRLHQIILNLVSNAEKFTTKGKITVSINLQSEDDEQVTIEFAITDTGIGIPKDKIDTIFENFQQASTGTSRLYGGTGLGLAIVKQLVEPQGGSINVTTEVGVGSTFSFTLSFDKTEVEFEQEIELTKLDAEIKNINILIVEDVALNQLLIKTLLDAFGFKHDSAFNGKLALEKLQTETYDVILMDLQMPEMDGFETTEYIRNTLNSKIPIIALTADVTTVDFAKCKAFGMDDYLSKPVDEKLLYDKIILLAQKPTPIKYEESDNNEGNKIKSQKYVDLSNLNQRTRSNPKLMVEMISLYLEQTPPLINIMKQSLHDKDWNTLQSAVHKMIPSFSIMGISKDFENIAKRVQEDANNIQLQANGIHDLVLELENICTEACRELEEEFNNIKNAN